MQVYILGPPGVEDNLSSAGCQEQMGFAVAAAVAALAFEAMGEPGLSIRSAMLAYRPLAEGRNDSSMK